jgi:predicted component of type VI protein secretion system
MIELTWSESEYIKKIPNWNKNNENLIRDDEHLALTLSACLYGMRDEKYVQSVVQDLDELFSNKGHPKDFFTKEYLKFCNGVNELRLSI